MGDLMVETGNTASSVSSGARERSRRGLVGLLIGAGILHFVVPSVYERIVPRVFTNPRAVVYWSGVAEIVTGTLVAIPRTRRLGAWSALVLFVAVYPANIQMAIDAGRPHDALSWGAWLRLPLQFPLFAWAYSHTR